MIFAVDGSITPCCGCPPPKGDYGNIFTDYFQPLQEGKKPTIFANDTYRSLRNQLLTGNLQDACRTCRMVGSADISVETLRQRVINHLDSYYIPVSTHEDLCNTYAISSCLTNVTERCNFSCIYCFIHSNDNGKIKTNYCDMNQQYFLDFVSFLVRGGLKSLIFCGLGELTVYPSWKELCKNIFDAFPSLKVSLVSNFGKKFTDTDLDLLRRFYSISISCDTFDAKTYSWLRRGGRLSTVTGNIDKLRSTFSPPPFQNPVLCFNVTESDAIVDGLTDLARYASLNNMYLSFSNLAIAENSVADKTKCITKMIDIQENKTLDAWEVLYDLPRRMNAQNPMFQPCVFGPLYSSMKNKVESITYNNFKPQAGDIVYQRFAQAYPTSQNAYLRKIYLSFDDCYSGIFMEIDDDLLITLDLPYENARLSYRTIWCRVRGDGNLEIIPSLETDITVGKCISISSGHNNKELSKYNHILLQILSYNETSPGASTSNSITPLLPDHRTKPLFIRDCLTITEIDVVIHKLISSQEPVAVWGAGARAEWLFSDTSFCDANLFMVIDAAESKQGTDFCGFKIKGPEAVREFPGTIVVTHATSPLEVERYIRDMNISNEVLIL